MISEGAAAQEAPHVCTELVGHGGEQAARGTVGNAAGHRDVIGAGRPTRGDMQSVASPETLAAVTGCVLKTCDNARPCRVGRCTYQPLHKPSKNCTATALGRKSPAKPTSAARSWPPSSVMPLNGTVSSIVMCSVGAIVIGIYTRRWAASRRFSLRSCRWDWGPRTSALRRPMPDRLMSTATLRHRAGCPAIGPAGHPHA